MHVAAGRTCRASHATRVTRGVVVDRDRDEFGKARNSRPRDALGRPLPHGSQGVERVPDELDLSPADSLAYAQDLLDRGLAFNAHEVLEAALKNAPDDEREMWQGLAQLAVGVTHIQRGNNAGAAGVLARAAGHLEDGVPPRASWHRCRRADRACPSSHRRSCEGRRHRGRTPAAPTSKDHVIDGKARGFGAGRAAGPSDG